MTRPFQPEIYAIDFGTSNSLLAAANRDGVCEPIPLDPSAHDPSVLRSVWFFSEQSEWSFGAQALESYVADGTRGRFIRSVKRFLPMASFSDTRIGARKVLLEELVGVFLREMRLRANRHFDCDVKRVLLGRPARFSDDDEADRLAETRLRRAAKLAGFDEIHFCPEPLAAAYDFGSSPSEARTVLIGDFGGGTSDYTLARFHAQGAQELELLGIGGIALAGDALDGALMRREIAEHFGAKARYRVPFGSNWLEMPAPLLERLCSPAEICLLARRDVLDFLRGVRSGSQHDADREGVDRLLCLIEDSLGFQLFEAIEATKCALSEQASAPFRFAYPGIDLQALIGRDAFERATQNATSAILARLDQVLARAGVAPSEVDLVCCTGGTAKVPIIVAGLSERFGAGKLRTLRSFHSVIQGLAQRARALL